MNIQQIMDEDTNRAKQQIPIINTSWVFSHNAEMYVWKNPKLDSFLSGNKPVYAQKIIYFNDSILKEEDIFYSGKRQKSKLIDPPYEKEGHETIIIINKNGKKQIASFYCPEIDSINFASFEDARKIIEAWGISYKSLY